MLARKRAPAVSVTLSSAGAQWSIHGAVAGKRLRAAMICLPLMAPEALAACRAEGGHTWPGKPWPQAP
eukprot:15008255-Alexandrium_andersonii.AAC.1